MSRKKNTIYCYFTVSPIIGISLVWPKQMLTKRFYSRILLELRGLAPIGMLEWWKILHRAKGIEQSKSNISYLVP
jgi:hypothetical protein